LSIYLTGLGLIAVGLTAGGAAAENVGRFEEKHPGFRRIVPEGAVIERLGTGFKFTEGPVWNAGGGFLLFSDIPAGRIRKWTPDGGFSIFRDPSGNSNGLTYDKQGRLIACEHGNRRVTRTEHDGSITVLADNYKGTRLNSPNDVVVKSDGSIYFTDPPYGLPGLEKDRDLDFNGVYRISPGSAGKSDDKTLMLLVDDFPRPNGLAFSPDEKTLYIGDSSDRRHIRAFDVQPDGTLANGRVFVELKSPDKGGVDGMKVDVEGNLYTTGPGAVWVFDPEGKLLGRIVTPEIPANCAWGDADWKTLYITARTSLYRVRLNIPGVAVP